MLEAELWLAICGPNPVELQRKQKCVPFVIATDGEFSIHARIRRTDPVFSCRESCASCHEVERNAHDDRVGILSTGTYPNSK
jgi:hypothetical protein